MELDSDFQSSIFM